MTRRFAIGAAHAGVCAERMGQMDVDAARATELRRFLRARRARLSPADVGLPADTHRRAVGLRREDVAELAGISVGQDGLFEVGRAPHVSVRTVHAIGEVLHLDSAELTQLQRLSGAAGPADHAVSETVALDAVQYALRAFTGGPAHVMDRNFMAIALNDVARVLLGIERGENSMERLFLSEERRSLFLDWREIAARFVAAARLRYPGKARDAAFESVIADLRSRSDEFGRLWDAGDLGPSFGQVVRIRPPGSGIITLAWVAFPLPERAEHMLALTPAVDEASRLRIAALMEAAANAQ